MYKLVFDSSLLSVPFFGLPQPPPPPLAPPLAFPLVVLVVSAAPVPAPLVLVPHDELFTFALNEVDMVPPCELELLLVLAGEVAEFTLGCKPQTHRKKITRVKLNKKVRVSIDDFFYSVLVNKTENDDHVTISTEY